MARSQAHQLVVEITYPNDVSTQMDGCESVRLINQDQSFLSSLYGSKLLCRCTTPPVAMHIKQRSDAVEAQRFWLSDNPGSEQHDIECPLYSHKLAPKSNEDPYRIQKSVHFRLPERNQNHTKNKETSNSGVKAQKSLLKPLVERVFRYLYENSLAGYYFGGRHDAGTLVRQFKRADANNELLIDGTCATNALFYGMKGLAMMKHRLRSGELTTGLWLSEFSRYENKDGGFLLNSEFFPSTASINNPKKRGPFMLFSAWAGKEKPICCSTMALPVVSESILLPVTDIQHREVMISATDHVDRLRDAENRLYIYQPYPALGAETIEGEMISGRRTKKVIFKIPDMGN
ncbi:hypothetical protein C9975_03050 [Thalassospira xiamenensis]|nr:hypothetical protein C9975_03050 [Thalassospira xiamenensis]